MLPFGSKLVAIGSLLSAGDAAVVKKAPRAGDVCTELNSEQHFYAVTAESDTSESIRLGLKFEQTGDLSLTDQGYVRLTYVSDIPDSYTLVETQTDILTSYSINGNTIDLQLNDSQSGTHLGPIFILFDYLYNNERSHKHYGKTSRAAQQIATVHYCTGVSPTADTPTFDLISPLEYCEEVTLSMENTYTCRACSFVTANSAPLTESYSPGDYLEIEFSGYVDFKSLPDPIKEVRWLQGNVWQIFFSDWYDFSGGLDFELELAFIGSQFMVPSINWSRVCLQEALAEIDPDIFVSNVPESCVVLQDDRWQHTWPSQDLIDVQLQLILDNDRDSDFFLKDYSYVMLNYFPAPEASGVQETGDNLLTTSMVLDDKTVTIEFDDEKSGENILMLNYGFNYGNGVNPSYQPILQEVYLCEGPNPTPDVPTVEPVSDAEYCNDITDYVSVASAWTCRACMSLVGSAPLVETVMPIGSFIEMEFEGQIDFVGLSDMFSDAINLADTNVWRLYYAQEVETLDFQENLKFTGSTAMFPRVTWAQTCIPPGVGITSTQATSTEEPIETVRPLSRLSCHTVSDYTYNVVNDNESGVAAVFSPQFSSDLSSDLAIQDFSYLQLTYSENFGFVTLPDFSFPVEVVVDLNAGWPASDESFVGEDNMVIIEFEQGSSGLETFDMDINFSYTQKKRSTPKSGSDLIGVQLCHRSVTVTENGPKTHPSWCQTNTEFTFATHENCEKCATLQILNADELNIGSEDFIEMETDGHIEFTDMYWPFTSSEYVVGNVVRVFIAEDFIEFDGIEDGSVSVGEIRFTNNNTPLITFMNVCPIDAMDNSDAKVTTTTTTTSVVTDATEAATTTSATTTTTTLAVDCTVETTWKGATYSKLLELGQNSVEVRVNMPSSPEMDAYSGFIIFSRKNCGNDFLEAFGDGRLHFDIMDGVGYYDSEAQYSYHRVDGARTSITIQFNNANPYQEDGGAVLGNTKRDQFMLTLWGMSSVDFGTKDMKKCLEGGMVGLTNPLDVNYTQCAAAKNVGF